ncbi:MAG TPA: hypothetical protein VF815_34965 [Myxococcaceae bacterium]|jgi:hypothetical protein
MTWRICGLLGAALAAMLSCGPSDDEAMKLKEGENLNDISECPFLFCDALDEFCGELLFDYGRSPPLCMKIDICERLECLESGRTCALFEGQPAQVRCVED